MIRTAASTKVMWVGRARTLAYCVLAVLVAISIGIPLGTRKRPEKSSEPSENTYEGSDEADKAKSGASATERKSEKVVSPEEPPGPAPGYNRIQDPSGSLTVEVPSSWGAETGSDSEGRGGPNSWSYYAGEYIPSSITTARSLDA